MEMVVGVVVEGLSFSGGFDLNNRAADDWLPGYEYESSSGRYSPLQY